MFQITFKSRVSARNFEGPIDASLPASSQVYHLVCRVRWPTFSGFLPETPRLSGALLYCTALHCTALHCTVLHCTALHCPALHCTALHCPALHCTALHCTTLPCTALHCTALHCTVLYCTVLYWSQLFKVYMTSNALNLFCGAFAQCGLSSHSTTSCIAQLMNSYNISALRLSACSRHSTSGERLTEYVEWHEEKYWEINARREWYRECLHENTLNRSRSSFQ